MSKIILIRGIPGSGKSTKAQELAESGEAFTYHETDKYWIRPDGVYDFNPKLIKQAHAHCLSVTTSWIEDFDKNIAVSNTFTQLWEMQPYLDLAEKNNYDVKVFRCTANYGSIHNVPESTIQKMKDRFEDYEGEILIENKSYFAKDGTLMNADGSRSIFDDVDE